MSLRLIVPPFYYPFKQHDYLARILNARVYEVAIESPLQPAPYMSRAIKNTVLLKVRSNG